jgi:hypothetical protein
MVHVLARTEPSLDDPRDFAASIDAIGSDLTMSEAMTAAIELVARAGFEVGYSGTQARELFCVAASSMTR